MLILADNDVGGAVAILRRILESAEWIEFSQRLEIRFIVFEDVDLTRDATDRTVWLKCQDIGAILITGNRASGPMSLEQTIQDLASIDHFPVITIGDPQRIINDRAYARESAISLLDLLDRIEDLRGIHRLFIP